jgi:tRNA modification GTPase
VLVDRATSSLLDRDTIAAIATATGGGLGILRISGPDAARIGRLTFSRDFTKDPRRLVHGTFHRPAPRSEDGAPIRGRAIHRADATNALDEGLAVYFPGPRSFTGEDVVELHLHGGALHLARCLEVLVAAGARLAEPGEFSRRAFLNGRIDLTRAEAIADLIAAQTDRALRQARAHLSGALFDKVASLRDRLLDLRARIEVNLDFVEEDVPLFANASLAQHARDLAHDLGALANTYQNARRLRDGATIVLSGPPNAGKSSLFNALCEADRAIVTPIAGTTRDTLREPIDIRGLPVLLVDTAGLRELDGDTPDHQIEQLGIARSRRAIEDADLTLILVPPDEPGPDFATVDDRTLLVWSKADLLDPKHLEDRVSRFPNQSAAVSATTGHGLDALRDAIARMLGEVPDADLVIVRERQHQALLHASQACAQAADGLSLDLSPELPAVDLQEAMDQLDQLVGKSTLEDVLDRLFSTFCIGK